MTSKYTKAEAFWDKAGDVGYAGAMFASSFVERHVNQRLWELGVDIGRQLGFNADSRILDLGCGDGALANLLLSKYYRRIDGFDLSIPAIARANKLAAHAGMHFEACDITQLDFERLPQYDGAYLWGILHHVKEATLSILHGLAKVTKKIVILEPNGNHVFRKLLEKTAPYKAMGEESFRTREMEKLFKDAGFYPVVWKRLNLFPNFTPEFVYKLLKPLEPFIEQTPVLRALCTDNLWGFQAR